MNWSINSHLITKFSDINIIVIEESKPLLENREFKKGIFCFYLLNINISLGISGTLMKILDHIDNIKK